MVTSEDILDAINHLLVVKWKDRLVCRGFLPKDFTRPSFYIVPVKETRSDANCTRLRITAYYTVVVYEIIDEYGEMDAATLMHTQSDVIELFAPGKLNAAGRSLNVTASAGGMNEGEAYVDIQVDYYRLRTDVGSDEPLIREVTTTLGMEAQNGTSQY